jgi:hypothetical protein
VGVSLTHYQQKPYLAKSCCPGGIQHIHELHILELVQQLNGLIQNDLEGPIIAMCLHVEMLKDPILRLQEAVVELTKIDYDTCYDSN